MALVAQPELPPGWEERVTDVGQVYWENVDTGMISTSDPEAPAQDMYQQ